MPTTAALLGDEATMAIARAVFRLSADGGAVKAKAALAKLQEPETLDLVDHWGKASTHVDQAREGLQEAQQRVRLVASAADDEALREAVDARDEARRALLGALDAALQLHMERHGERQWEAKHSERDELERRGELSLAERLRLERLHSELLPVLDAWVARVDAMETDKKDLVRLVEGGEPSVKELVEGLRARHADFKKANRKFLTAEHVLKLTQSDGDDTSEALATLREARGEVQSTERSLRKERTRLAHVASTRSPELYAEPLLRLGSVQGVDSDELRQVLVERELAHYEREPRPLSRPGARHKVYKASYGGEVCVLKEYELRRPEGAHDVDEWKGLAKEVTLLGRLAHCPYIADVEAVFVVQEPLFAAYVQLPFFNGGDLRQWVADSQPPICRRVELLTQLAHALQYMHERGIAHGDVKLENVLVAIEGERATAHLADFESARVGRTTASGGRTATRGQSTTGYGHLFTDRYVAPEILQASREGREQDAKPTAMGDMFSYGVCCLFACCLPPTEAEQEVAFARFEADGRQLTDWSNALCASANAHLPSLLVQLLAPAATHEEALDRRLDAKQVLTHPFLDTFEAIELARRKTAAAELARQAQERESDEERLRLAAEAAAQYEAIEMERQRHQQQMRRKQQELDANAERREAELRAERRANEAAARSLQADRERLERQEAEVAQAVAKAAQKASAIAAKGREIAAAEASLQREDAAAQARLAMLRQEQHDLERGLRSTRDEHSRKAGELERLKRELVARETADLHRQPRGRQTHELTNSGADVPEYLSVVDRVEKYVQADHKNPIHVIKIEKVFNRELEERFRTAKASRLCCPPKDCTTLQLFHGTSKEGVDGITKAGFRLPSWSDKNMFGQGVYFATDSTKSAQELYTKGSNQLLLCDVHLGKSCTIKCLTDRHPLSQHVKQAQSASTTRPFLDVDLAKVRGAGYDSVCAPRGGSMAAAGVKFDEYVVYDADQAIPRYIVHFGKYAAGVAQPRIAPGAQFARHELFPQRSFDPKNELDAHFRLCESHVLRQLGHAGKRLVKVEYIVNPPLIRQFEKQLKDFERAHIPANMVLAFHATRERASVDNIVQHNFDPSRIGSQNDSGWWGRGFYFSEYPATSLGYGSNMLLCRVLPGKTYDVTQRMDGQPLRAGFNSHRLQADANGYGQELVIDHPKQILPCYILHIQ